MYDLFFFQLKQAKYAIAS